MVGNCVVWFGCGGDCDFYFFGFGDFLFVLVVWSLMMLGLWGLIILCFFGNFVDIFWFWYVIWLLICLSWGCVGYGLIDELDICDFVIYLFYWDWFIFYFIGWVLGDDWGGLGICVGCWMVNWCYRFLGGFLLWLWFWGRWWDVWD